MNYRTSNDQLDGEFLTLEQIAYATPIVQGSLFAFDGLANDG
jgi:hypothetical protein